MVPIIRLSVVDHGHCSNRRGIAAANRKRVGVKLESRWQLTQLPEILDQ